MRFLLITLMIALMPVRAWLGDSMAMQTLGKPSVTIEIIAVSEDAARAVNTFQSQSSALPCHDAADSPDEPCEHADCAQCTLCQICHGVVLLSSDSPPALPALPNLLAHGDQAQFASVPGALHLKPPIT